MINNKNFFFTKPLNSILAVVIVLVVSSQTVGAADPPSDFALQVSPSPLVATIKPGVETVLELKIRNAGTQSETLKIEPRKFTVNNDTGQVDLDDRSPSEIAPWVSFSAQSFTVKPGEWFTQKVRISLPKDTGFSYSMALIVSRTQNPQATQSGRLIKGSVAVFTLINVDRPGATRKLEVSDLSTTADVYEYVPATITMSFKNTGNTIVQPYGNVFIQRGGDDDTPVATLPVNDKKGYLLPGSSRVLTADWADGFPSFKVSTSQDGAILKQEQWDWQQVSKLRLGQYTAKLVAVYNDGRRDVPIEKQTTFWVLPWKIILAALVIVSLVLLGVWTFFRKIWLVIKRPKKNPKTAD